MHTGTSRPVRHLIAIVALIAGFASAGVWLINRPETLAHALAIANLRSTFQVGLRSFHWSPQRSALELAGLSMEQPSTGKRLDVARIRVHYRLLGLLRGKVVIDSLELDDVRMSLPPQPAPRETKAHKRIDIARLLLIKNLEINDAAIRGFSLAFGSGMRLDTDELHLALVPSLFGEGRVSISTGGVRLAKGDRVIATSGLFSLKSSTELERWKPDFPYLNAFHGRLVVQDAFAAGLSIERVAAEVRKEDEAIDLKELRASINGRELRGAFSTALDTQLFTGSIDIPEPIRLPYIGKPLETLDTAGEVSAAIQFDGKGFLPAESEGAGHVDLVYRFDHEPEVPIALSTNLSWSKGAIALSDSKAAAGRDAFVFGGRIDVAGKQVDLFASGRALPLEDVFLLFQNPHLAKIFGPTDFEGTFKGWGKQFEAKVRGITRLGGWKPIAAEQVVSELIATYDTLSLKGTIFTGSRETGKADLFIRYGARGSDGTRAKDITLDASIADMPVDLPLGAYALTGTGNGSIRLRGPHTAFTGKAEATVTRGEFHGIPFDRASATLDLTRRRLTFGDFKLQLPKAAETALGGTLVADITDGSMRMHGEPLKGLTVDATYAYAGSRWNIAQLRWNDPATESDLAATGSYVSGGGTELRVRGRLDAEVLPRLLTTKLRDARGPVDVDVALRGSAGQVQPAGLIGFKGTMLRLRNPQVAISELNGAVKLSGDRISFENLTAEMDDGSFTLSGSLAHRQLSPASADLALTAKTMRYRTEDRALNLEMDAELKLTGAFPSPLLSGDITILDGRYTKDFNIIELISGSGERERTIKQQEPPPEFNPRLAIRLRNSGDLAIRNNVGDIWLNTNVDVGGTRAKPHVSGAIDVASGEVHYLGIRFDITRGFIEFRGRADEPYLEVYASKEINVYNVNLVLHGTTDNLQLDLSATSPSGPLEKRDVVSLILFGTTEQDRIAAGQRAGSQFSTSMVAQSLTGFVSGPVSRLAGLDEFRLEASDPGSMGISRISAGKKVSDRLTVKFATDISKSSSVQTFAAEYLITDNLLIKGSQSTDATSEFSGILRFRLR